MIAFKYQYSASATWYFDTAEVYGTNYSHTSWYPFKNKIHEAFYFDTMDQYTALVIFSSYSFSQKHGLKYMLIYYE